MDYKSPVGVQKEGSVQLPEHGPGRCPQVSGEQTAVGPSRFVHIEIHTE